MIRKSMDLLRTAPFCAIVLSIVVMLMHSIEGSSVVAQPSVILDQPATVVEGDGISLRCQSSIDGTELRYMHWYRPIGTYIYTYDYNMSLGSGEGDYDERTSIGMEGVDGKVITMTISDAVVTDGGEYYCSINPNVGVEVFSDNVEVTIIPGGDTTLGGVHTTVGGVDTTSGSGCKGLSMIMTIFLVSIAVA